MDVRDTLFATRTDSVRIHTLDIEDSVMPKGVPANSEGISKMDAMRQAVAELGLDAKNPDIEGFLKKKFKIDMDTKMISSYKSKLKEEAPKAPAAPKTPAPAPETISKMEA